MSGKWIVSFCKVAEVHYLGEVDIFFTCVCNVMMSNVLPLFFRDTVYNGDNIAASFTAGACLCRSELAECS